MKKIIDNLILYIAVIIVVVITLLTIAKLELAIVDVDKIKQEIKQELVEEGIIYK